MTEPNTLDELKEQIRKALGMCNDKSCTAKCVPQLKKAMALFTEHRKQARIEQLKTDMKWAQNQFNLPKLDIDKYVDDYFAQIKRNKGEDNDT